MLFFVIVSEVNVEYELRACVLTFKLLDGKFIVAYIIDMDFFL
jgi:hypothetical protein